MRCRHCSPVVAVSITLCLLGCTADPVTAGPEGESESESDGEGGEAGEGEGEGEEGEGEAGEGEGEGEAGEGEGEGACPAAHACASATSALRCVVGDDGATYVEDACGAGEGCVAGRCVVGACSDSCVVGGGCVVGGVDGAVRDLNAAASLADRARAYEKWIRRDTHSLVHGGIASIRYTDSDRRTVRSAYIGDTALHTGVYLAAEAFRLRATGAADARAMVKSLVQTHHLWFGVTGSPGVLATIAAPAGDNRLRDWTDWDCADVDRHCDVAYDGARYDYVGDPSRDMYVGPVMGLVAAYDALGPEDEATRALIREDLVTLGEELLRLRAIPVRIIVNGARLPVRQMQARFFVPDAREMVDGAIEVIADTGDVADGGSITGGQEFMPNPAVFFRQVSLLSNLPDTPRSSSGMMVAAFAAAALHVSEGVPAYAARREALQQIYLHNDDDWGNVNDWLAIAGRGDNRRDCDDHYFGLNLFFQPTWVFGATEHDPTLRAAWRDVVLNQLWPAVATHKNVFFDVITTTAQPPDEARIAADALDQLRGFQAPPRVEQSRDLRGRYDEGDCRDHVDEDSDAVDVADREVSYFMWHSEPWKLRYEGDARQSYPGHDFLVAYWMARAHGLVEDDAVGRCAQR